MTTYHRFEKKERCSYFYELGRMLLRFLKVIVFGVQKALEIN